MAQFTKVNGDFLPVLHLDSPAYQNAGLNALSSAATVQPQGPKLDFFTLTASGSSALSGAQVNVIVQTVQQLATVYIYEFTTAGPDTIAFAVYPTGAWSVDGSVGANVVAAVRTALTNASLANAVTGTATATFTN